MSGAALETPNVGPRVTSIGALIDAAPRAGYPSGKAELIARLNSEGAKRHLGAATGRSRTTFYVTSTLPLAIRDALLAQPPMPPSAPPAMPQTAEQEALSNRFSGVLASKPKAAARVARDLRIGLADLHDMARDGRRITVEAAVAVSRHFKVDLHALTTGAPAIDERALRMGLSHALHGVLPYVRYTNGVASLDPSGSPFNDEDAAQYHALAVVQEMISSVKMYYFYFIRANNAHVIQDD